MGRFLVVSVILFGLSLIVTILVRQIGVNRPHIDLWLDPGDCTQPCWRGIRPGTQDSRAFLDETRHSNRYNPYIRYGADDVTISMMRLDPHGDILLGNIMLAMGTPTHVRLRYVAVNSSQGRTFRVGASLYYGDLVEVMVVSDNMAPRLSPYMKLRRIEYHAPSTVGGIIPLGTSPWRGFSGDYTGP